jgi:hypothetical protein
MPSGKLRALAAALTLLSSPGARASVSLDLESGAVWNASNDVRIPSGSGTRFSLTNELKSEAAVYFRAGATWHINDRHDLSVLFAPLRIDSSGELSGETFFAGASFRGGVPTEGRYRFDSYRLTYRYNFLKTEKLTFGLGITANVRDAEVELRQGGTTASDDNTGLVPLLNFRFEWRFAPRWSFLTEGDALYSNRGRIEDVLAAVQWQATDRLALRLGYRLLEGGADSDTVYNFALFNHLAAGLTWRF